MATDGMIFRPLPPSSKTSRRNSWGVVSVQMPAELWERFERLRDATPGMTNNRLAMQMIRFALDHAEGQGNDSMGG